jgi:hypothetical protein
VLAQDHVYLAVFFFLFLAVFWVMLEVLIFGLADGTAL